MKYKTMVLILGFVHWVQRKIQKLDHRLDALSTLIVTRYL